MSRKERRPGPVRRNPAGPPAIRRRRSERGFTLIELALVTILIMIMINVATPLFRHTFQRVRLESACRDLSQLMQYLRNRSVVEGTPYRLAFDFEDAAYWGESPSRGGPAGGAFEPLRERIGGRRRMRHGISVSGTKDAIVFHPDGRIDSATLTLTDPSGLTFALTARGSEIRFEPAPRGESRADSPAGGSR